jgi:hypothetical protein
VEPRRAGSSGARQVQTVVLATVRARRMRRARAQSVGFGGDLEVRDGHWDSRIACLEDPADVPGMVFDVGFICLLTRCRPGLTMMVATCGGYTPGCVCSWQAVGKPGVGTTVRSFARRGAWLTWAALVKCIAAACSYFVKWCPSWGGGGTCPVRHR